jgi:hypothetical protein
MYDTGEYDIHLDLASDNYVVVNLYPIHLESIGNFVRQIRPQNENTLIVLLGAFQCIQERDFWVQPLDEFCKSIPNPVVVFTGNLVEDPLYRLPKTKFGYKRISMFELVSNLYWYKRLENQSRNVVHDCDHERKFKFYWASSKDWYTRRYILAGLISNRLIENNLVNYKCLHTDIPGPWIQHHIASTWAATIDQECHSIGNRLPLPFLDDTVEFTQTNIKFYLDSNLGIITDTFFDNGVFLSEKIFNAINYQQLFFYIGYQGTLQYLREQGYNVFDDIIDTRYDTIEEPGARLVAARQSLLDFLNQPLEKIQQAYKKSRPAIKHNKQLLQQQRPDLKFTQYIRDFLNEHRTTYTDIG